MTTNFWRNRPVFVTGCTGLLGGWLVEELLRAGAHVTGLVRDWVPASRVLSESALMGRMNVVRGDIEDFDCLERAINEYEIETVFHLAAQTIVGTANRNPRATFETNIRGTWNLLEACRRVSTVKRIVVASSDKAYGDQVVLPYSEETPLQGTHPYDVSKSCTDLIATTYHHTYGLPVCITRCGNFYGGGDLNFNRIIPGTIRSLIESERPVIRGDGKSIRDYFYVKDGARAYMHLAERMDSPGVVGEAFNFSNEIQVTVLELVNLMRELMGSDLEPVVLQEARNEIAHQYLSAEKARRVLNWSPAYALREGLWETIEWYRGFVESPQVLPV